MRSLLLVAHAERRQIVRFAGAIIAELADAGFEVRMLPEEAQQCRTDAVRVVDPASAADGAELVLVLGGDGTFLRATEMARPAGTPMLGVNLGHVGFLAQAEPDDLRDTVRAIADGQYSVEERVTIDADVVRGDEVLGRTWALNEASLERTNRERMLEIAVAVDKRPLLRFGCDGIICATPTGSTAYAFSAGGPIVWPNVDALVIVPIAAHALFSRPIVAAPGSVVDIDLLSQTHEAVLSCDGRRSMSVPSGARVQVRKGAEPVRIARLERGSFADRLVNKFGLPVRSLREASASPGSDSIDAADSIEVVDDPLSDVPVD